MSSMSFTLELLIIFLKLSSKCGECCCHFALKGTAGFELYV
jgi:hypothetical protein